MDAKEYEELEKLIVEAERYIDYLDPQLPWEPRYVTRGGSAPQ